MDGGGRTRSIPMKQIKLPILGLCQTMMALTWRPPGENGGRSTDCPPARARGNARSARYSDAHNALVDLEFGDADEQEWRAVGRMRLMAA
jgi:hypothetical protein